MLKHVWQNFEQSVSCTEREYRHCNKGNFATFYLIKSKFINNILPQFGIAAYLLNALFLNCSCVLGRANYPQEILGSGNAYNIYCWRSSPNSKTRFIDKLEENITSGLVLSCSRNWHSRAALQNNSISIVVAYHFEVSMHWKRKSATKCFTLP